MTLQNQIFTSTSVSALGQSIDDMNSNTPSIEIYRAIYAAATVLADMPDILSELHDRTQIAMPHLEFAHKILVQHRAFGRDGEAEALALDALEQHFAWGLYLRSQPNGELFLFTGTHWRGFGAQELRNILQPMRLQANGKYGKQTNIAAAVNIIRDLTSDGSGLLTMQPTEIINTLNCELWIGNNGSVERRIHRPESQLRYVLPLEFRPDAACPIFEKTLSDIFANADDSESVISYVLELFGYAIQPLRDIPVILFLWGGGANGKSTLLKVLQAIVGPDLVHADSLEGLSGDRFVIPNLDGRLLFIEDDAKEGVRLNGGVLKKLSENKRIDTRRVRSTHRTSFWSMVMPIIAMNGAPVLDDVSEGMVRRLHVLRFDRKFLPDEMDRTLAQQIIADELPGILNRLVDSLSRMRLRGRFAPPLECQKAVKELLAAANPLHAFLEERCAGKIGSRVGASDLYAAFRLWMNSQGQKPSLNLRGFSSAMRSLGFVVKKSSSMMVQDLELLAADEP